MEEVSLYRKYRPHNFDNLVGQDHVRNTLVNALKNSHVVHAYLFTGPRGTGKTSTARLLAKALNCQNLTDGYEPCNECEFCKDINEGRLIDLIEIDAASNRGIDEVRDLKEKINFAPTRAKYKVYIIDEVHMMTKEAFNALLKTLEEPPSHAYFILATTEVHKIPETIISRCQRFDFRRIGHKSLLTRLGYICQLEGIEAADSALEAISKCADGGLRDAIGLLEQLTVDKKLDFEHVREILGVSDINLLNDLFDALMQNHTKDSLRIIHELHNQGSDLKQFVHEFVDMLRQKMLESIAQDKPELTNRLIKMIDILQEANYKLDTSIPQLALEIAVVQLTGGGDVAQNLVEATVIPEKRQEPLATANVVSSPKAQSKAKKSDLKVDGFEREHKNLEMNLAVIKENWPRILERIKTPSLKISLRNAFPIKIENHDLTLQFSANFHKDKVMEHDHRVELEGIIKELLGDAVKIIAVVKELEIKPVIQEREQALDEALGIFGGEVVEEK